MTPTLFAGAFRAYALPPRSLADRLFALPAVALIPCASRRAGLRKGDGGLRAKGGSNFPFLRAEAAWLAGELRAWDFLPALQAVPRSNIHFEGRGAAL